jgi:hypothetical protein
MDRVTAVFDNRNDAERAVQWLQGNGVPPDRISVITRHEEQPVAAGPAGSRVDRDPGSDLARGAGTGAAAGAGVGALFGLAAALIPGIGPFITAGALAAYLGVTGGAAAAGAIVGGTSGAIAGALSKWGLDQADAEYYGGEVERGGIFVAADLDGIGLNRATVEDAFRGFGARFSGPTRTATA